MAEDGLSLGPESKLTYVPSLSVPTHAAARYPVANAKLAFDHLLEVLERSPLEIVTVDRDGGTIATRYQTDPELFLDCGHYVRAFAAGDTLVRVQPIPAARERILLEDEDRGERAERLIELFGRTLFRFTYDQTQPDLTFSTLYAVSLRLQSTANEASPVHEEVVSFEADGRAGFDNGVTCQSSGRMENLLEALIDETLALGD